MNYLPFSICTQFARNFDNSEYLDLFVEELR